MANLDAMLRALRSKCGFDPAEVSTKGQIRILARVANTDNWRVIMQRLKALELDHPWTLDLSQLYFLKSPSKKSPLVKGWRLILKASDIEAACQDITKAVQTAPVARVVLDEIELPGGGQHRMYNTENGKGATLLGSSAVGSVAIHSMLRPGSK